MVESNQKTFSSRSSFEYEDLLACARGELFGPGNPRLPLPPMLMFDRIAEISSDGGAFGRGLVQASFQVAPDKWFFGCHFEGDPVMPGCLGLDAMWQLVGFFLGWRGGEGVGRALGVESVKFAGQVLPTASEVVYRIDVKRVILRRLYLCIGDGTLFIDGKQAYVARDVRVGLFKGF